MPYFLQASDSSRTMSVFIRGVTDAIFCQLSGPQAESVVMFGCQDHSFHAGFHKGLYPLLAIQSGGIECFRIGITVSPFAVVECVKSEVYESVCFHSTCLASGMGRIASGALTELQALNRRRPAPKIRKCFFMGVIY